MNRPINLGYLVPEFPSQTHAFFWREVQALRAIGVTVNLLSTRRPASGACRHEFAQAAARETHYVFPPRWIASIAALLVRPSMLVRGLAYIASLRETRWPRRLRLIGLLLSAADLRMHAQRNGIDHIHVHSCADAAHLAALCRILGGPSYSLTLHGDLPVYGTDHRRKTAGSSFVVCVTRALRDQVERELGLDPLRLPVIWMGVDTDRFVDAGQRVPVLGSLHILTVSRLHWAKGHRHVLAAMRFALDRGVQLKYTIAGDGPHRAQIEEEVRTLGLQGNVTLAGTCSEAEVFALHQQCDAFVLPSVGLGEAAPVSVMEAMSCGLPVICSTIGGTPDMIEDAVDGFLVPQRDEAAIADRLIALASDLPLRARIGLAARNRAVSDFDSRRLAQRLNACFAARSQASR